MSAKLSLLVMACEPKDLSEFMSKNPNAISECEELILLITKDRRYGGQARMGNRLLDSAHGNVVGAVHADTVFGHGDLTRLAETAHAGKVCGMVGRALLDDVGICSGYVWGKDVASETPVSTLDGCSIFSPKDIGCRFDEERFDSFHCPNEDFCLSASSLGIRVVVPKLESANHIGKRTYSAEWQAEYDKYKGRLLGKWCGASFRTT
jgi:hypothetical protein